MLTHIHSLAELGCNYKNVLIMAILSSQELLVTILESRCLLLIDIVYLLIKHIDYLIVFFQDELTSLDQASLRKIGQHQNLIERLVPLLLCKF